MYYFRIPIINYERRKEFKGGYFRDIPEGTKVNHEIIIRPCSQNLNLGLPEYEA
jgi:hypothetical protein